jgi:hypothetical protein
MEALKTCKAFAEETETLNARVNALTENSASVRADFKRLAELSDPLRRILLLEDWIISLAKVVDVQSFGLAPVPVTSPKTWAERLVEDD